ncbi:MAG: hypothetical protein JSU70_11060 [Phycisphaerales bacterium]|nr:MAG: hypothetical protein JSU70_11060 [Phycisphaerales bacterium]
METNDAQRQDEKPCCDPSTGGDCCSAGQAGGGGSRGKSLRTALFVVVILLAGAVAGHSLLTRNGRAGGASACAPGSCAQFVGCQQATGTAKVSCGVTLDSLASLNGLAADKKAVFILLPGESQEQTDGAAAQIERVIGTISAQDVPVASFTMNRDAPDHTLLVDKLGITSFPSVVVMGKGYGLATVSGEVTESELLRAFVTALTPMSCGPGGCGPGGCCPSGGPQ